MSRYKSYVLPLIDYGSDSWGSTTSTNTCIERINKLQKRAARILLKAELADMYQRLGWVAIKSRINYNKSVLTYLALRNLTSS